MQNPTLPYTLKRSPVGISLIFLMMIVFMALALAGGIYWPDPIVAQLFPVVAIGVFILGIGLYLWYIAARIVFTESGITSINYVGLAVTHAEMDWTRIQDVTYKSTFLQALFDVGTLYFQDAATHTPFQLSWVGDADEWLDYIEREADAHPYRVQVTP